MDERLERYVTGLFAAEDPALEGVRARHGAAGLPPINISAEEGKFLHVLLKAIQAKTVLELGTLGGYSGVWLARALPPTGKLTTIEIDPRHATLARQGFQEAGVGDRVEVVEGAAMKVLPTLSPGFDAIFLDADKEPLPLYFDWAMKLLRKGGLLICDNAFFDGAVVNDSDDSGGAQGVRAFNKLAAADPRLVATIVPIRDGIVVGVKVRG